MLTKQENPVIQLQGPYSPYIKAKIVQHGQNKNYILDQEVSFYFDVVQPDSYILLVDMYDIASILMQSQFKPNIS